MQIKILSSDEIEVMGENSNVDIRQALWGIYILPISTSKPVVIIETKYANEIVILEDEKYIKDLKHIAKVKRGKITVISGKGEKQ